MAGSTAQVANTDQLIRTLMPLCARRRSRVHYGQAVRSRAEVILARPALLDHELPVGRTNAVAWPPHNALICRDQRVSPRRPAGRSVGQPLCRTSCVASYAGVVGAAGFVGDVENRVCGPALAGHVEDLPGMLKTGSSSAHGSSVRSLVYDMPPTVPT